MFMHLMWISRARTLHNHHPCMQKRSNTSNISILLSIRFRSLNQINMCCCFLCVDRSNCDHSIVICKWSARDFISSSTSVSYFPHTHRERENFNYFDSFSFIPHTFRSHAVFVSRTRLISHSFYLLWIPNTHTLYKVIVIRITKCR